MPTPTLEQAERRRAIARLLDEHSVHRQAELVSLLRTEGYPATQSSVSRDLLNVSRVLRLSWFTKTVKIVLPSAIPMMFTGLRLSLGIGWMVLIAAEMLAQNPGLGKFVWDEFQNGSSNSLARIMVAVLVIGTIGFILDRGMLMLQRAVSWDKNAVLR